MTELVAIEDTFGSFATFRQAFGIEDDSPWEMPVRVFFARVGGANVLVDAGVGPPGGGTFMRDRRGDLPRELERRGIAAADVDLVVFTHLHVDHIGWALADGEPYFPNARYVVHAADLAYFGGPDADALELRDQLVELHRAGRVEAVDRDGEIHPGVSLRLLPGHTPGHCGVEIEGALVFGDAAVHVLQLANPDQSFFAEADSALAAATRRSLLPELADAGTVVGSPHFPTALGRIRRDGDGFGWAAAD
jgi:glyoxylase-like metal-dependent hydrolase (beta-lactamase superfamily II)